MSQQAALRADWSSHAGDVNDLLRAGKLSDDPFEGATPIDIPKPENRFASYGVLSDPQAMIESPPQRKYLLRRNGVGMIPQGKVGFLVAAGGTGKTMLECALALCVALGKPLFGELDVATKGAVVLGLAEEDHDEILRRLYFAANALELSNVERQEAKRRILPMPLAGVDVDLTTGDGRGNATATPAFHELYEHLASFASKVAPLSLVVLDPLSGWAGNEAETSSYVANRFVQVLNRLTKLPGNPTVLCAHHTNKVSRRFGGGGSESARGSSAITDGARWVLNLEPEGPRVVKLDLTKHNYSAPMDPIYLVKEEEHHGAMRVLTAEELAKHEAEKEEARSSGKRKSSCDADIDAAIIEVLASPQPSMNAVTRQVRVKPGISARTDRIRDRLMWLVDAPDGPATHDGKGYRLRDAGPESVST